MSGGWLVVLLAVVGGMFALGFFVTWGESKTAPATVRNFSAAVSNAVSATLQRGGGLFYRAGYNRRARREVEILRHTGARQFAYAANFNTGGAITPITDASERRLFFLHEVAFHTEIPLRVDNAQVLTVNRAEMQRLGEYCALYAEHPGSPQEVMQGYGITVREEN